MSSTWPRSRCSLLSGGWRVFLCARMRGRRLVPDRRRMFAHDAATLAADAALHPARWWGGGV